MANEKGRGKMSSIRTFWHSVKLRNNKLDAWRWTGCWRMAHDARPSDRANKMRHAEHHAIFSFLCRRISCHHWRSISESSCFFSRVFSPSSVRCVTCHHHLAQAFVFSSDINFITPSHAFRPLCRKMDGLGRLIHTE